MQLGMRIAALLVTAAFAAVPVLGLAAQGGGSCCCPPPCHQEPAGCEVSLAAAACCDTTPATLPGAVKPAPSAPGLELLPARRWPSGEAEQRVRTPSRRGDLPRLVSPLRRSVVLRL